MPVERKALVLAPYLAALVPAPLLSPSVVRDSSMAGARSRRERAGHSARIGCCCCTVTLGHFTHKADDSLRRADK